MDASFHLRAEQLASEFASQAPTAADLNGLMRLMMKSALERMLNTVMDVHLGCKTLAGAAVVKQPPTVTEPASSAGSGRRSPNWRNGRSRKTVQGDMGELTLATPRDRDGSFEPQLIGKHQRRLPGFDEKIRRKGPARA
jgi:putative transposase